MDKKIKILYHHRTLGDGAEGIHIAEMVNAFRQEGHKVMMVGPSVGREGIGIEGKRGGKYLWIKKLLKGPLYELAEISYNLFGFLSLRKAIRSYHPDLIYDRYIAFNYSCVAAGKRYGVPVFLEVNAPLALERDKEKDERLYFRKLAYWLEKKTCTDADQTIVVSTPLKKYLCSLGVPEKNIQVVVNGVNTDTFYPQGKSNDLLQHLGLNNKDIVIGFVGILRHWHGIDLLLKAMREICQNNPDCKCLLVGDGPIREEIDTLARSYHIEDKVIITGRVPHEKVGGYISLFDIAVSPKATFYASPMKIIEYMALGKPVVAPDMENIRDLITDGIDGLLFPVNDCNSFVTKLQELVCDEAKREFIALGALRKIEKELRWTKNVEKVLENYLR